MNFSLFLRKLVFLLGLYCLFFVGGCTSKRNLDLEWTNPQDGPVWPESPADARIQFLASFPGKGSGENNAEKKREFWRFVVGASEKGMALANPFGVATDGRGRVWIADPGAGIIHFFTLAHNEVQYIRNAGDMRLKTPAGVAFDPNRELLYLSDTELNKVFIFNSDGDYRGELNSPRPFKRPGSLAVDPVGNLYVSDIRAGKILIFTPDGRFIRELGSHVNTDGRFNRPVGIAVSRQGHLAVVDAMNFRVEVFGPDWESMGIIGGLGDVPGAFARPRGIAFDSDQHIYVADAAFDNIQIFDLSGKLLLYFGKAGAAAGEFCLPAGLTMDEKDRLFVVDSCNHRIQVFKYLGEKN